jgi:pSer/pThr/pTyr-binding forkhead associated (FHA) protein
MQPLHADEPVVQLLGLDPAVQPPNYILKAAVCTMGRSKTCDIVVPQQLVSRLHAKIERTGPRYMLHDAGSANGTFVNSRRIFEPHLLQNDDLIGLGSPTALLRFFDPDSTVISAAMLYYDDRMKTFSIGRKPLDLTPTQFRLLLHLYQHAGSVCSRESCAQAIWGPTYAPGMEVDALDEAVRKLRGKLREIDSDADLVKTRRGVGFELGI